MIVDIGSDYAEHSARMVELLRQRECEVFYPTSLTEFSGMIALSSEKGWMNGHAPEIAINLHFQNRRQVVKAMQVAEVLGTRVMNPPHATTLCEDRIEIMYFLKRARVEVPAFYYGHPSQIPEDFGEEVILKDPRGHLVMRVKTEGVHSLEEVVYCERVIPNPSGVIRTVYYICGEVFTVAKTDTLRSRKRKPKERVDDDTDEVKIVSKIQSLTNLDFFNADFMGDVVIDVNPFPNFFFHEPGIQALVDNITTIPIGPGL